MAIAQRLGDLMGGEIGVDSEAGKGSRFHFTVPLALPAHSATSHIERSTFNVQPAATRLKPGCKVKALVVDDMEENREVLSRALQDIGCEVVTANDGQQGVDLAMSARPDIIFMDIRMPGMDGLEAVKKIKSEIRNPKLEIRNESGFAIRIGAGARTGAVSCGRFRRFYRQAVPFRADLRMSGAAVAS